MSTLRLTRESVSTSFYKYGLYVIFGVLALVFSLFNANFASPANAVNLLQQTASTGIAAAGLVFVLVSGGIDISMGSTIFLSASIVGTLANKGLGVAPAFILAIACGMAVGIANGFFVSVLNIPPLIVTLGSAIGLYDATTAVWVSIWLLATLLFAFGFVAGRVSGRSLIGSAVAAAVLLAVGAGVIIVKFMAMH